jgi:hypothetical protein
LRSLRTACILLWFSKPSETFISKEVMELARIGLPLSAYSLYVEFLDHLSPRMAGLPVPIRGLGIPSRGGIVAHFVYWIWYSGTSLNIEPHGTRSLLALFLKKRRGV